MYIVIDLIQYLTGSHLNILVHLNVTVRQFAPVNSLTVEAGVSMTAAASHINELSRVTDNSLNIKCHSIYKCYIFVQVNRT